MLSWILSIWIGTEAACFLVYAWLTKILGFEYAKHKKYILILIILSIFIGIFPIIIFVKDSYTVVLKTLIVALCISVSFLAIYIFLFGMILIVSVFSKLLSLYYKTRDKFNNKIVKPTLNLVAKPFEDTK